MNREGIKLAKQRKCKNCNGCRALIDSSAFGLSCVLGYRTTIKRQNGCAGMSISISQPEEPCPKPRTWERLSKTKRKALTKDELSLLLFFEAAAVDRGGHLHSKHMNEADFETAKDWTRRKFVTFNRLEDVATKNSTHNVALSERAWDLAHQERKDRAERIRAKRKVCF